jgi:hypothetical protein
MNRARLNPTGKRLARMLAGLPKDKQAEILGSLTEEERLIMQLRYGMQMPPPAAVQAQRKLDENVDKQKPS